MNTRWYEIIKNNINLTYPVKIVLIGVGIVFFSVLSLLYESRYKKEVGPQTQPTPIPTPTPSQKEVEPPPDISNWQLYDGHGLKFRYPPSWRVRLPGEAFTFGNRRTWAIDDISDDESPFIYLLIERIRRYAPLPTSDNILAAYLVEQMGQQNMEFSQKRDFWQEFTFKGRPAIRITATSPWAGHPSDNVYISIPEESGILIVSFSWSQQSFDQAVKNYLEPLIASLEIKLDAWPKPGTYLALTPASQLDTSSWRLYQGENFSLRYPESWNIEEEERKYERPTVILSKFGEEPKIFIGRATVFSTSGAVCANEPYCKEIGEAEIRTKDNTYFATIVEKKLTFSDEENNYEGDPSYYVFTDYLNRVPSEPTVTALYRTVAEGQEIVNILSTISY